MSVSRAIGCCLLVLFCCSSSAMVIAQESTPPAATAEVTAQPAGNVAKPGAGAHDPLSAGNALTVFSSLILVLVIMLALAWLLRRMQLTRSGGSGSIQMLSQLPLGTREKVVLLRVGEENVLVGCSPAGVNRVHSWTGAAPEADAGVAAQPGFAAAMQSVLQRGAASK